VLHELKARKGQKNRKQGWDPRSGSEYVIQGQKAFIESKDIKQGRDPTDRKQGRDPRTDSKDGI
jgi:hypothetical protein